MDDSAEPTHLRGMGAFGMIPEWLLSAHISSTAKVVFGWMACKYASRATWTCWPGQSRIADDLNVSVSTIKSAMKELVDVGALTKRQRVDEHGAPSSNYYQLVFTPPVEKLTHRQKTDPPPRQISDPPPSQKTGYKPEVLEPDVLEREVRRAPVATLVESPIAWHKRHGSHVNEFCDWVCFPQELKSQFANRASLTDADIVAWATQVRGDWQTSGKVPTGSMYDFWNARWAERNAAATDDRADIYARLREANRAREERKRLEEEKEERRRVRVRKELEEMERFRQEVWDEQRRQNGE